MTNYSQCPLCEGKIVPGTTTVTVDYESGVVVMRHVPADVCDQCGEAWLNDNIAEQLEENVQSARSQSKQIAVIDMAA